MQIDAWKFKYAVSGKKGESPNREKRISYYYPKTLSTRKRKLVSAVEKGISRIKTC